jgi:hypothetical protein
MRYRSDGFFIFMANAQHREWGAQTPRLLFDAQANVRTDLFVHAAQSQRRGRRWQHARRVRSPF